MSITSRDQAIEFLYGRIDYERMSALLSASDFKLDRMRHLLLHLDNPHEAVPVVHIAGTKGKGSTAAMIASILQSAGHRVGLFTSPHLECYEERVRVDDEMINERSLVELVDRLAAVTQEIDAQSDGLNPTFFELTTALAWLYFHQQRVDIAVLEVGLGGRLDSTNVCCPEVCVLTTISRDHMHILGSQLSKIAAEKAGIIKLRIPVVSGVEATEARVVIERIAAERNAPLMFVGRDGEAPAEPRETGGGTARREPRPPGDGIESTLSGNVSEAGSRNQPPGASPRLAGVEPGASARRLITQLPNRELVSDTFLSGRHQRQNAAVAAATAVALRERGWKIDDDAVRVGLEQVRCPVRVEVVSRSPLVVLDAAHNWASGGALLDALAEFDVSGPRVLIFATSRDKDVPGLLRRLLAGFDCVILTAFQSNPRAMPLSQLETIARRVNSRPAHSAGSPEAAWAAARRLCPSDGLICVAGSFFLAAELRRFITLTENSEHPAAAESCDQSSA